MDRKRKSEVWLQSIIGCFFCETQFEESSLADYQQHIRREHTEECRRHPELSKKRGDNRFLKVLELFKTRKGRVLDLPKKRKEDSSQIPTDHSDGTRHYWQFLDYVSEASAREAVNTLSRWSEMGTVEKSTGVSDVSNDGKATIGPRSAKEKREQLRESVPKESQPQSQTTDNLDHGISDGGKYNRDELKNDPRAEMNLSKRSLEKPTPTKLKDPKCTESSKKRSTTPSVSSQQSGVGEWDCPHAPSKKVRISNKVSSSPSEGAKYELDSVKKSSIWKYLWPKKELKSAVPQVVDSSASTSLLDILIPESSATAESEETTFLGREKKSKTEFRNAAGSDCSEELRISNLEKGHKEKCRKPSGWGPNRITFGEAYQGGRKRTVHFASERKKAEPPQLSKYLDALDDKHGESSVTDNIIQIGNYRNVQFPLGQHSPLLLPLNNIPEDSPPKEEPDKLLETSNYNDFIPIRQRKPLLEKPEKLNPLDLDLSGCFMKPSIAFGEAREMTQNQKYKWDRNERKHDVAEKRTERYRKNLAKFRKEMKKREPSEYGWDYSAKNGEQFPSSPRTKLFEERRWVEEMVNVQQLEENGGVQDGGLIAERPEIEVEEEEKMQPTTKRIHKDPHMEIPGDGRKEKCRSDGETEDDGSGTPETEMKMDLEEQKDLQIVLRPPAAEQLPKEEEVICENCSQRFETATDAVEHEMDKHPQLMEWFMFYCRFCKMTISFAQESYFEHMLGHRNGEEMGLLVCHLCRYRTNKFRIMCFHMVRDHKTLPGLVVCQRCCTAYSTLREARTCFYTHTK